MWRALPGLIFLGIVIFLSYAVYLKGTRPTGDALLGEPAPALYTRPVAGFDGIPDTALLFNQQYVLVNFFASWCTPCLAEHPHLVTLHEDYALRIVGVGWRDSPENIRAMLQKHGNPYDYVGLDRMDSSASNYSVQGLPESFLVGPDGKILATHSGPILPRTIETTFAPLLERADAAKAKP